MGTLLVAVALLGVIGGIFVAPELGDLGQPTPLDVWPQVEREGLVRPEPTELMRYIFAISAPVIIAAILVFGLARGRRFSSRVSIGWAATIGATASLVVIGVGWANQAEVGVFGAARNFFDTGDLLVALLIAAVVTWVATTSPGRTKLIPLVTRWSSGRMAPGPMIGLTILVTTMTMLFVAPSAYPAATLDDAPALTRVHVPFTFPDFAAFGNGSTPLTDFASQYSNLLPWLLHPVLSVLDYTPSSFTVLMAVLSTTAMLVLWRILVLTVGNEWVGACLYLPVLAVGLRPTAEVADERVSNASLFQIMPERYLLPLMVAWMCARHLSGRRPHQPIVIFGLGAVAVLNNPEFGGPCLAAAFVALLVGGDGPPIRALPRLAAHLIAGVGAATLIVSVIILVRTGDLLDVRLLTYFSRLFGAQGFGLLPMPALGFHLIVYVTFASALILASANRTSTDAQRALWGMLAFTGTFGLGAGTYYVGRSGPLTLVALFPIWGLALALLAWATLRWLLELEDRRRLLTPAGCLALCALVGLGLATTDLSQTPSPRAQLQRLTDPPDDVPSSDPAATRYIANRTDPGEVVLILRANGHQVARAAGVRNIAFLGHPYHVITEEQVDVLLSDLQEAGGTKVFVAAPHYNSPNMVGLREELRSRGWKPTSVDLAADVAEWRLA